MQKHSVAALQRLLSFGGRHNVRLILSAVYEHLCKSLPGFCAKDGPVADRLVDRALKSAVWIGRLTVRVVPPAPRSDTPQPPPAPRPKPKQKAATWFSLTVLDEVGQAVPGIKIAFDVGGDRLVVPTNGSGVARLDDVAGVATVSATLFSIAQARQQLASRWKDPRQPNIPTGSRVFQRPVRSATDSLTIPGATPTTLVLTPYLECREIPGAYFEFGRSFVRSQALQPLAGIAEELEGDDSLKAMIFGHTDLAGSEALNKELSERRAKALYALLTQDAGAWEELFTGSTDGANWKEKWDLEEAQHMLNALGVTDDDGNSLKEDGVRGSATIQAIHRFQSGNYPDCPAEQARLPPSDHLGPAGRKELFLAYAKRISRKPVDPSRFVAINGSPYMGCGEYNPLSLTAKDAESRRAVVFLLDPAAGPPNPPCLLRSIEPCRSNCSALPSTPNVDGSPPYRCKVYRAVAKKCPCQGGADLSHDLILRFPITLKDADQLPNTYVLDSDDGTIHVEQVLASDARANDEKRADLAFENLPNIHKYRLRCTGDGPDYDLFDFSTMSDLLLRFGTVLQSSLSLGDSPAQWLATEPPADPPSDDAATDDDSTDNTQGDDASNGGPSAGDVPAGDVPQDPMTSDNGAPDASGNA